LRLYYSLIIKGGDARYCVLFEAETQDIASYLRGDARYCVLFAGRRKILRLYMYDKRPGCAAGIDATTPQRCRRLAR
jgi:hypothetical protein